MRWVCSILAVALLAPAVVYSAPSGATNGPVCIIEIREDITHNTLFLVRRGLQEARDKGAVAVVLDMDTNGGGLIVTESIIKLLGRATLPTYTYVNDKAFSAGALIANATDKIFMSPGSVIGAATPIQIVPGQGVVELPPAEREKMNSGMRALVRTVAQQKGHNGEVFEAMVDKDLGLVIDGISICETGKLLTLTNVEAAKPYGKPPKPLLSAGTVNSVDELLERVGLAGAQTFAVAPSGFEVLGRWLTMLGPVLMLVGFVAIYVEFKTPGIGVPTVVAVIAFGLYFLGNFIAGLAGTEEVVIFAIGVILLAIEIFVLPGFGFAGVLGITAILVALILGMTERFPNPPLMPSLPQLKIPITTVSATFIGSVGIMLLLGRYLPKSALFRKMELSATTSAAEGYTSSKGEARELLGAVGMAETMLRPSGKGRFGEKLVDVVTAGDMIAKGAAIKIVEVQGSRVVVTQA